ncbi:hypothetical protein EKO27_g2889 [Xylaria grammica]|uniref:Uncharacterized protein n=1 Tax=Xylaria grammica TaxID=363999 RepID=A0A439DCS0_9PEZI|nr:hypothetical protein EKO27_g2889 [Xylaria grammica]
MIYLLASPPRFVRVKEAQEDWGDFEEKFRTTIVPIKLHPSTAYFACNWRGRIPFPVRRWRWYDGRYQTTLERYGWKWKRAPTKHQPWEPTEETPDIPYDFISENPHVAWELLRTGERVPLRLDRLWYQEDNYRPWERRPSPHHALLSGNEWWEFGQFQPEDLKRVKRLALEKSGLVVSPGYREGLNEISNMLKLFTGLDELFLQEHDLHVWRPGLSSYMQPDASQNMWVFTPSQEIDALSTLFERETLPGSCGYESLDLKAYKDDNMGDGSKFFVDTACKFEERLLSRRDESIRGGGLLVPYKIPKISLVYIGYPWRCKGLFDWRRVAWKRYQDIKEDEARSRAAEEALRSIDVPRRPIHEKNSDTNLSPSPSQFSDEFRDEIEVLDELESFSYRFITQSEADAENQWLLNGTISAPELE